MATQFDTLVDPETLTLYARDYLAALAATDTLTAYAVDSFIDDIEFTVESLVNLGIPVAEIRTFDTASKILNRQFATASKRIAITPVSGSLNMGEYARLKAKANSSNLLIQQAYSDLESVVRSVWQRIKLLTGEAIAYGLLTINEGGVTDIVDFGDNASRKATAGTAWTDTVNADAWTDHADSCEAYEDLNGFPPALAFATTATIRLFQANAEVRGNVAPVNTTRILPLSEVNGTLEADALCPLVPFNEKVNATSVLPAGSVIYMPPTNLDAPSARRVYGTSAYIGTVVDLKSAGRPGIAVFEETHTNPLVIETVGDALFMPAVVPNHFYNFTR